MSQGRRRRGDVCALWSLMGTRQGKDPGRETWGAKAFLCAPAAWLQERGGSVPL